MYVNQGMFMYFLCDPLPPCTHPTSQPGQVGALARASKLHPKSDRQRERAFECQMCRMEVQQGAGEMDLLENSPEILVSPSCPTLLSETQLLF